MEIAANIPIYGRDPLPVSISGKDERLTATEKGATDVSGNQKKQTRYTVDIFTIIIPE